MIDMKILDYRIKSDEKQLIVVKASKDENGEVKKSKRTGEEVTTLVGYYGNFKQVFKGIRKDYLLSSGIEIKTITDLRNEVEYLLNMFDEAVELEGVDIDD